MEKPLGVAHGPGRDPDPVLQKFAPQLPSTLRELAGMKLSLPEPLGPVGRQRAVRRTGGRIFGDAKPGSKVTRDEVGALSLRRDDRPQAVNLLQQLHVRSDVADLCLV